jgi:Thioredoxin
MRKLNGIVVVIIAALLCGMDGARLTGLWPCDVACQGGAYYQRIFGVSLLIPALIMHGLLFIFALRDTQRGAWSAATIYSVWFMAGSGIFFLLIAYALGLTCSYCLLSHGLIFLSLLLCWPFPAQVRLHHAMIWLIGGALLINALYHHTPVADQLTSASTTQPNTTTPTQITSMRANMDRGRYYGQASSTQKLYVALDLSCKHCSEWYPTALAAWTPLIQEQRVQVVVLHMVRPAIPVTHTATRLAFAAAGLQNHAPALSVLLGSNAEAQEPGLILRLADVVDTKQLQTILFDHHADIDRLIAEDQNRIKQLGLGQRTPAIALEKDGKIIQRWAGNPDIQAIIQAIKPMAEGSL